MRSRLVLLAATVAILLSPIAALSAARPPTPDAATTAFGRWLHGRYGSLTGYWTCPRAQVIDGRIDCLAEVRTARRWHQTSASATSLGGRISFSHVSDKAWIRHWWPYSRRFIVRSRVDVPGVMSVNTPTYDWGFLAEQVEGLRPGPTVNADAYDGYGAGWLRFYRFTCSAHAELITCANKLGDAMRYRPR